MRPFSIIVHGTLGHGHGSGIALPYRPAQNNAWGEKQNGEGMRIVNEDTQTTPDWSAWSREAVRLMQERNDAWIRIYGLEGRRYQWSLDEAQLRFRSESDEVSADICVIGSVSRSEGTFCWAWANEAIPTCARRGLASVREFGKDSRA